MAETEASSCFPIFEGAKSEQEAGAELPDLLSVVQGTLVRSAMLTPGQTVVVGVSGGPDSTALLHVLARLRDEWRLSLVACHLNHGFRGAEAEGDAEYVRALCDRLDVPCRIATIDVPALQKRRRLSAQQAAREVRHAFLRRVAIEVGAERIALAHTRNDRTETVLLNTLRGSGLEGLAGFPPIALPLIRPFYDVSRRQVEQYCRHFDLKPRQDSSNAKMMYRRNRIRAELLPHLRATYNPQVDDALLRLADIAAEDNALLESLAAKRLQDLVSLDTFTPPDTLQLPILQFNAIPLALRRRVLRQAIAHIRGSLQDVTFETVETIVNVAEHRREGSMELPADTEGTVRVRCGEHSVTLTRVLPPAIAVEWQQIVKVPGLTQVPGRNVVVCTQICSRDAFPDVLKNLITGKCMTGVENTWDGTPMLQQALEERRGQIVVFPLSAITLPLTVRSWRSGDRIRPRGLNGTKKIQDLFTDLKIPALTRPYVPLLAEAISGRVLAAGEWRADETALFACRLPCAEAEAGKAQEDAQRKIEASENTRELLAALFLYQ